MRAEIINSEDENFGKIFKIIEWHKKFVTLDINGRKSDYGKSEVQTNQIKLIY